jgi:serine phosphatase RsbU (regulator of sigma subunit)
MDSLQNVFMPHGYCFSWYPEILILHAGSDIITSIAYFAVAGAIVYFTYGKRNALPKSTINLLIGTFLVFAACGAVHLSSAVVVWFPEYWISGWLKLFNALVSSYVFVFMLIPLIPIALEAPTPAQLEAANQKLRNEIEERQKIENQLRHSMSALDVAHQKLMESLQYAKMIQTALLPNLKQIKTYLPNSFLIWLPRDIVGGDMVFTEQFEDGVLIAVMDCTGHGVPGAFMTMIATTHLRRIVVDENCHEPSEILKRLNGLMKNALQQEKKSQDIANDNGLDAGICFLDRKQEKLLFAGARIALLHLHNNVVQTIKGDKQSLGYQHSNADFDFKTHSVTIEKGATYYLTTDGMIDELGGEKWLPFGLSRLANVLLENTEKSFDDQAQILLERFYNYKNNRDRQDDITVIGFSV